LGVGEALDFLGESLTFVADENCDRAAPVDLPWSEQRLGVRGGFAGGGGHDKDSGSAKLFDNGCGDLTGQDGQMERGCGGGAQGFGSERAGRAALPGSGGDGGRCAERGSGAEDGADVARVLDADQDQDERGRAALSGTDDLFKREGTRSDE